MYYLRSALVYLWAALVMTLGIPYRKRCLRIAETDYEKGMRGIHKLAHWFAGTIVSLAGVKLVIKGRENLPNEGPSVYVGNHQSFFDIPLLLAAIPTHTGFLAKTELKKVPILANWIEAIGSGFIERENDRGTLKVILNVADLLKKSRHSIVIFPEGTRSVDGKVDTYRAGGLKVATRSKAPIIPFAIDGSDRVMPKGHKGFKRETVVLTFFPALDTSNKNVDTGELAETCHSLTAGALSQQPFIHQ